MRFSSMANTEQPYRFTPVPRRSHRADGWSSDRQHAFVWALARLPSVSAAARSVGMSARSAYRLRNAPGAEGFARAWDDAWRIGTEATLDTAIERAVHGQEYPIMYRGKVVGKVRRFDNRLAMRALLHQDRSGLGSASNKVSSPSKLSNAFPVTVVTFADTAAPNVESLGGAS